MCVGNPETRKGTCFENVCVCLGCTKVVEGINIQHEVLEKPIWKLRIGIHSGPLIANFQAGAFDV